MPTERVEIGFDLVLPTGPFFTLDDPVKGQLNNVDYTLAGFAYYDVTSYVKEISLVRGKNNNLDAISAGDFVVQLDNRSRAFDPEYDSSPFAGNILPKRVVRYYIDEVQQFQGVIDDWNFVYTPNGDAIASFVASDGFVYLNNQTLGSATSSVQLSGARINTILDDPFVQWPSDNRDIDAGQSQLGADLIPEDQNVLAYLQTVERSEQGLFFISKTGVATFRDRADIRTSENIVAFADDGSGIGYQDLLIGYGSEDLANEVVVESDVTGTQVTATDEASQQAFGIFNTTLSGLLNNSNDDLAEIASLLVAKNAQPVYRFDQLTVRLNSLTDAQVADVIGLELGDTVSVSFTPSSIPPAILKYATVIRVNHTVDLSGEHLVTLGLATQNLTYLILDDIAFGRLDQGALSF
jgi:hypothetical protein